MKRQLSQYSQSQAKRPRYGGDARYKRRKRKLWRPRRRWNRRGKRSRPNTVVMRGKPIADKVYTALKYVEFTVMTSNEQNGTCNNKIMRASVYDPDWTDFGTYPQWYSHFAGLYKKYRVHGIKYKITVTNTNVDQLTQMIIVAKDNSTRISDFRVAAQHRDARLINLASKGKPRTITGYIPVGKAHGLTKTQMKYDEDFISDINANPAKETFLHIITNSLAGNSCNLDMCVQMWLYTEFFDRKLDI